MVICLERGADLQMAQRIPLPLTVSCFSIIQIGFTFLVPAHPGSPRQRTVKWVYVCVCGDILLSQINISCRQDTDAVARKVNQFIACDDTNAKHSLAWSSTKQ